MIKRWMQKIGMAILGAALVVPVAAAQDYSRYGYRSSPYKAPAPMRRYQPIRQATPDQMLRQGVEQTFSYLRRTGSTDLSNVLDFVNKELGPYFDFEYMTRLAAGKMAKELTDEQIKKLSKKLEADGPKSISESDHLLKDTDCITICDSTRSTNIKRPQQTQRVANKISSQTAKDMHRAKHTYTNSSPRLARDD